jgi:hypothetical protein
MARSVAHEHVRFRTAVPPAGTILVVELGVIERLARLGYVSIGIVYMIVGGLAAASGLGRGGSTGGQATAFRTILEQPFGRVALGVIAVGLLGYTLWRFVSATTDSEHRGDDAKGLALRAGSAGRGVAYALIALEVLRLLLRRGGGSGGGDAAAQHWTARLMEKPFGPWLVGAVGLGVVAYGAYQLYAAWDSKLSKRISLGEIDSRVRRKVVGISRFGIAARGFVFFVIGGSVVVAALKHNPSRAHGTSGALEALPQPMLVLVGLGLAAYGVYALVNARYRRITT